MSEFQQNLIIILRNCGESWQNGRSMWTVQQHGYEEVAEYRQPLNYPKVYEPLIKFTKEIDYYLLQVSLVQGAHE